MHYAILAYHVERTIEQMSPAQDAALMTELRKVDRRMTADGMLGPAARLDFTQSARTLRDGMVIDGPFAETKEQLLGFYLVDCATHDEAVAAARDLGRANPTAVYEIRPVLLYLPGAPLSGSEAAQHA
ncbi:YciI family protein [Mesorhizobium marinum]|uniref:YciI family protein n=1 Tax=Mesorhizobium marinum TaxID=3228790 RepID=A0ABV3QTP9_9HYPH